MTRLVLAAVFALIALASLLIPVPAATAHAPRQVTIDATQFEFTPGRVAVDQGDDVVLTLTSTDVTHGFYLDGYGIERRVQPGIAQIIVFVADQPGTFRFRCSVSCGSLHPFMIGELVVRPNVPLGRAAGFVLAAFCAGLIVMSGSERQIE